jgi:predicted component of type VI protein secretion system
VAGPLIGRVFPIDPNGFYIGRDRALSQVVVDHASVSKRHVWIGYRDGAVMAIDQGSTNGTFLNTLGARMTERRLADGDTLIISHDIARFAYRA